MKTFAICLILVSGGLAFGWTRHNEVAELRRRNGQLQEAAAEVERYKGENKTPAEPAAGTNELARLRAEWIELLKMRSEIGRLREAARIELPKIQERVERSIAEASQEQKRGVDLIEQRAAKLHSNLNRSLLEYSLFRPLTVVAKANNGRFPSSHAEFEVMAQAVPERERRRAIERAFQTNQLSPRESEIIGRTFTVSAQDFEFVPSPAPRTINDPPAPLLRERIPRQLPDGTWARWCLFTDGRVEELLSRDRGFSGELEPNASQMPQ